MEQRLLNANERSTYGKSAAVKMRKAGRIPAVMYDRHGKSVSLDVDEREFMKLFNRLPWLLIPTYIIGLYTSFVLDYGSFIPTSLHFLSPYGYNFSFVGILIACFFSVLLFMTQFRRSETKKIWLDILFFSFINAVIVLGIFLVL